MKNYLNIKYIYSFYLLLAIGLYSCASTGSPSGGPKDVKPPKLNTLRSTANKQIRFKPKSIEFNFDEFVEVKDATKQVLTSPPLTYIPKIKTKGKKVTFTFDEKEVLRDDATYTINFGESIVDFREGNKLSNFTFVFSTGDYLDSLNITGQITNNQTHEPEIDMVVFLYDNLQDTAIRKEKPLYFAKPDKDGMFKFKNIKADTFRIFAIKDENLNYKYDLDTENIAFIDTFITLKDTITPHIVLSASLPTPSLKIKSTDTKTYGKVKILCNASPNEDIKYSVSDPTLLHFKEVVLDSVNIYYHTNLDSFYVYILNDTIKVKPKGQSDFIKKSKFKKVSTNHSNVLLPSDSLVVNLNFPIGDININQILLFDTIGALDGVQYTFTSDHKGLVVKYPWSAGERYTLEIDSAVIKNIYGVALDSIGHNFTILTKEKTANLNVSISELDSLQSYKLRVFKNKTVITELNISDTDSYQLTLKGLLPDNYDIEIIEDSNKNGIWDPGSFDQNKQPEKYLYTKGEKLRENRDDELNIFFKKGLSPKLEPKSESKGLPSSTNKLQNKK